MRIDPPSSHHNEGRVLRETGRRRSPLGVRLLSLFIGAPLRRGRLVNFHQGDDVRHVPKPFGDASRHGRGHAERLMDADEL